MNQLPPPNIDGFSREAIMRQIQRLDWIERKKRDGLPEKEILELMMRQHHRSEESHEAI